MIPSLVEQTITGDTHAAQLDGANSIISDVVAGTKGSAGTDSPSAQTVALARFSADIGTTETIVESTSAMTPITADNIVHIMGYVIVTKTTGAGTATIRLKESTTTHFSTTSASISVGDEKQVVRDGALADVSVAAHTYDITIQFSANGGMWALAFESARVMERGAIASSSDAGSATFGGTNSVDIEDFSADIGTTETTVRTASSVTPDYAQNCISCQIHSLMEKSGVDGTCTYRFKEGAVTEFSKTGSNMTAGTERGDGVSGIIYNATAAAHTYTFTMELSAGGGQWWSSVIYVQPVVGVSGSDTHDASLTGSEGTCA